jgi:hypothetical protein
MPRATRSMRLSSTSFSIVNASASRNGRNGLSVSSTALRCPLTRQRTSTVCCPRTIITSRWMRALPNRYSDDGYGARLKRSMHWCRAATTSPVARHRDRHRLAAAASVSSKRERKTCRLTEPGMGATSSPWYRRVGHISTVDDA